MEQTDAILVGRTRFGESSLIVQWCAPEVGLFRTMAKGALRPKSPFVGLLDLFVSCDLRYVPGKSTDLGILSEARWTNPRLGLRSSYGRVLAATYFVKLITLVVERNAPLPAIHALLHTALDFPAEKDTITRLVRRFDPPRVQVIGRGSGVGTSLGWG